MTTAQDTLHPNSRPAEDEEQVNKLLDYFHKLNSSRQQNFVDYLSAALETNFGKDWGAPGGAAKKNREKLNKEEKEELLDALSGIGFSESNQEAVLDLFSQAVSARASHFEERIKSLLETYGAVFSLLDSDELVDELAEMIEEKETALAEIEEESNLLARELEITIKEQNEAYGSRWLGGSNKQTYKSVEETLEEINEENAELFAEQKQKFVNPDGTEKYLPFLR